MAALAPKTELLRSLGRLVKGLSALFWGLPITLLASVRTATDDYLQPVEAAPPILANALLLYGLWLLGDFQKQERVWIRSLERAELLAVANLCLAPFLFFWNRLPGVPYFNFAVYLLMLCGVVLLFNLNHVLQRLAAMLPDETLKMETRVFGTFNLWLLSGTLMLVAAYLALQQIDQLPNAVLRILAVMEVLRRWFLMFLVLLPLAMTMSLVWKIKEVVFSSVFLREK